MLHLVKTRGHTILHPHHQSILKHVAPNDYIIQHDDRCIKTRQAYSISKRTYRSFVLNGATAGGIQLSVGASKSARPKTRGPLSIAFVLFQQNKRRYPYVLNSMPRIAAKGTVCVWRDIRASVLRWAVFPFHTPDNHEMDKIAASPNQMAWKS